MCSWLGGFLGCLAYENSVHTNLASQSLHKVVFCFNWCLREDQNNWNGDTVIHNCKWMHSLPMAGNKVKTTEHFGNTGHTGFYFYTFVHWVVGRPRRLADWFLVLHESGHSFQIIKRPSSVPGRTFAGLFGFCHKFWNFFSIIYLICVAVIVITSLMQD